MIFWSAFLQLVLLISFAPFNAEARTRAPKTDNERSLLYWRYLCENQAQLESIKFENVQNSPIELSCPSQGWKIHADGDQVREVVEDAKK
jgi:hypothetical protein